MRQIVIGLLAIVLFTASAEGSSNFFRYFGRICVVVYELQGSHQPLFRKDLSTAIAPRLEAAAKQVNRFITVRAPQSCTQPNQDGFVRQLTFHVSIKRQKISVEGREVSLVLIGGSSPSGLSEYALEPFIIVERETVSDSVLQERLIEFVRRSVIEPMKIDVPSVGQPPARPPKN